jgi:hypothetical protein
MENNKEIIRSETEKDDESLPYNSDWIDNNNHSNENEAAVETEAENKNESGIENEAVNKNRNISPDINTEVIADMDLCYGSRTSHYDLLPRKPCVYGQRLFQNKEDSSSPTVAIESVLLTSIIDAEEGRHMATVDIPGAFMQIENGWITFWTWPFKIQRIRAWEPWEKYPLRKTTESPVWNTTGSIFILEEIIKKISGVGLHNEPLRPICMKKFIDGSQCTVIWHVDDSKISHIQSEIVIAIIGKLSGVFGIEAKLTVHHGKLYEY